MPSKTTESIPGELAVTNRPAVFVVRFLILWLASLFVIAIVSLLSDINWARPILERKLSEAFHRRCQLGKLTWNFGLNGLSVETRNLNIQELSGQPFLSAGRSEIGFSVLALLSKKIVITHVDSDKANFRMVKTGKNTWNFDDLLQPGPEIKLLQLTGSKFDIIDESQPKAASRLAPFHLEKVELKLNFPRKNRKRPFFFSFSLPGKGYASTFTVDGLGVGELEKWKDNQYSFEANAKRINPQDLERFSNFIGDEAHGLHELVKSVKGFFDVAIKGDGTFKKGIRTSVVANVDGLEINNPNLGTIDAGNAHSSVAANVSKDHMEWQNLLLKAPGIELHSNGVLQNWQEEKPIIEADVSGNLPDLGVLEDMVKPRQNDGLKKHNLGGLVDKLKPARLIGSAELQVKIEGTTDDTKITTMFKTRDLAVRDMLNKANQQFPLLCMVGLSEQSKIESDMRIDNQERIEIVDGRLTGPGTNIDAKGWIDLANNKSKIEVEGKRIALNQAALSIKANDGTYKQLVGCIRLPGKESFLLDGTADAHGTLITDGDRFEVNANVDLHDASFTLKDNSLKLNNVEGDIGMHQNAGGGTMTLSGIKGEMGGARFQLDGKLSLTHNPQVNVSFHAASLDLKHLSALMNLFQIKIPVLTERQLYGKVKDVALKVTGSPYSPNIYFTSVPEDLYYQPPGLAKPLRAKAGTIVFDRDQLILREVALHSNNKTIITSLTIDKVTTACIVSRVKAKSDNFELTDIHYYLSSTAMPPPLRKAYLDLLDQYKIKGMHGRAYGDILCLVGPKGDMTFDGLIGCFQTGASVSGYKIKDLAGIFAAAGDQLLLQDLTGYIRGSKFTLDGYVDQYRSKSPTWRAEVTAKLAPAELIELIPNLTEQMQATRVEIKSKGVLSLRAKVQGSFDYNKVQYSLIANKEDKMVVQTPFGKLHQPADCPLTLDGIINTAKNKIEIGDTHLLAGPTLINLDGEIVYANSTVEGNETRKPRIPAVTLRIKVPHKSPVKTLVAMIDPPLAEGISGTIFGYLTLNGDIRHPHMESDLTVHNVYAPKLSLADLNGHLRTGGAVLPAGKEIEASSSESTESGAESRDEKITRSVLEIDSVKIRKLPITKLKANVALALSDSEEGSCIVIDEGVAHVADGIANFQARLNPDRNYIWLKADFNEISAAKVTDELMGYPDEITGKGHASVELTTHGETGNQLIKHLNGTGMLEIDQGIVNRFSDLQHRLTQYNLLTQGVFGFNLNNLLQSVWPVRSGQFKSFSNRFTFKNGTLEVDEMRFNGDDMRLWGRGSANLENNNVQLEIAGKIPRVQASMLGGSIGNVSRKFTLQKFMRVVTFGKLESLPSLPVLGAIATDKPRTFTFSVESALDNPKLMARSIEKSFKWLPNRPDATAHPVPGITQAM